jgi:hypothetical protein
VSSHEPLVKFFVLHLAHRFTAPLLDAEYAALPHVMTIGPDAIVGDGDDVCASFEGDTYSYVFDAGSGEPGWLHRAHVLELFRRPTPVK